MVAKIVKNRGARWSIDAVRTLNRAYICDDLGDVVVREARDRGHVAELPVMGAHALPDCHQKRRVAVMAGFVNTVHEWWCDAVAPLTICPVTCGTYSVIAAISHQLWFGQGRGKYNCNKCSVRQWLLIGCAICVWLQKIPGTHCDYGRGK